MIQLEQLQNLLDDHALAHEVMDVGRVQRFREDIYLRQPFQREPDFGVTSVNYDFAELLTRAGAPS